MEYTRLAMVVEANMVEVGGIEPPTRYVAQGLTGHCDQIVTLFLSQYREVLECLFME